MSNHLEQDLVDDLMSFQTPISFRTKTRAQVIEEIKSSLESTYKIGARRVDKNGTILYYLVHNDDFWNPIWISHVEAARIDHSFRRPRFMYLVLDTIQKAIDAYWSDMRWLNHDKEDDSDEWTIPEYTDIIIDWKAERRTLRDAIAERDRKRTRSHSPLRSF